MSTAQRRNAAGYTAAEVMIAITLLAIGGSGVIAMENAAIQGNASARRLDDASVVANSYADELGREASQWSATLPVPPAYPATFGTVDGATWNQQAPASSLAAEGLGPAFDINAHELMASEVANTLFCVQYRMSPMQADPATGNPLLVRADILVFWNRDFTALPTCGTGAIDPANPATPLQYHMLNVTAMLKRQS